MLRLIGTAAIFLILTILTQMGGLVYLIARRFEHNRLLVFATLYIGLLFANQFLAPIFGRVALPCQNDNLQSRSWVYCALGRNYVNADVNRLLVDYANAASREYPGTQTFTLDGSFPYFDLPLVPHLSHRDGFQIDLAYYYKANGVALNSTPSPLGYFAFEYPEMESCPKRFPTLRWNLHILQKFWPEMEIDDERMTFLINWMTEHGDEYKISKIFMEPHLEERWSADADFFRFQGCRAARHDDHIHIQISPSIY